MVVKTFNPTLIEFPIAHAHHQRFASPTLELLTRSSVAAEVQVFLGAQLLFRFLAEKGYAARTLTLKKRLADHARLPIAVRLKDAKNV